MDAEIEVLVDRVSGWANINSGSYNVLGLERMAAMLAKDFSELECKGDVFSLPPVHQIDSLGFTKTVDLGPMLRFWKRPTAPIQVLLVGHMDTVYELENAFQKTTRVSDNILKGPGVTDMKGGLCVMLEALRAFEKSHQADQLGWEVLINPDEEIGSYGSSPYLIERSKFHQCALLFEPAMDETGTLAGERKGSGNFVIMVYGRAAHAGRDFHQGRNAITLLSQLIVEVAALNGQREGVTLNVGLVQGGNAVNVVPALAQCRIDVRIQAIEDKEWVKNHLDRLIEKANGLEGFKVQLHGSFNRTPKKMMGKTLALYQLLQEVGRELNQTIHWKPSGGCCDGNNLAEAGLPNIDSLGVCGGKIHSDEEYMRIDSLIPRIQLTTRLLEKLSEGKYA